MKPCPRLLVALRGDEIFPRCGRPAREHRGHPNYQETTMTETTEPTREKIAQWLAQAEANDWGPEMSTDDQCAVLRLALRTLDAEAQLDHARRRIAAFDARDARADETIAALSNELAAMTERAERAERLRAENARLWEVISAAHDYAHCHSTGPAVPDALWEVQSMLARLDAAKGVR